MNRLIHSLAIAGILLGSACIREAAKDDHAEEEAHSEARDTHAEEENAIHLSEDMLRDLRISTAAVRERPGAAEVSVLGEIAADQSRYAEVAPPTGGQLHESEA